MVRLRMLLRFSQAATSSKLAVCALARQGRAITDKMLIVFKMRVMFIVIFFLLLVKLLQG